MSWTTGVRFPTEVRNSPLVDGIQTGSEAHTASNSMAEATRPEAEHSPPFSAEVKNGEAVPPLPHMPP
jgi:hypothetical protein